jgi:branched-chain amino acid transport system permease protein
LASLYVDGRDMKGNYPFKGFLSRVSFVWAILIIFLFIAPFFISDFYIHLGSEILILALFATSLNFILGYGGMLSFGHAAFYAIGAYTYAILAKKVNAPFVISFLASPLIAGIAGIIIGIFCIRLKGFYFAILTLAFGQLVWAIIFKWYGFTEGDNGITGIYIPEFLQNNVNLYIFTLIILIISFSIMKTILNSPFGLALKSIRENPERTEFVGININRYRLYAFVISTFFTGVSGALFAIFERSAFPSYAYWVTSGNAVIMTLLGGMHTFIGPSIGAVLILILESTIHSFTEYWPIVLGTVLILLVIFLPNGVFGFFLERWEAISSKRITI